MWVCGCVKRREHGESLHAAAGRADSAFVGAEAGLMSLRGGERLGRAQAIEHGVASRSSRRRPQQASVASTPAVGNARRTCGCTRAIGWEV